MKLWHKVFGHRDEWVCCGVNQAPPDLINQAATRTFTDINAFRREVGNFPMAEDIFSGASQTRETGKPMKWTTETTLYPTEGVTDRHAVDEALSFPKEENVDASQLTDEEWEEHMLGSFNNTPITIDQHGKLND